MRARFDTKWVHKWEKRRCIDRFYLNNTGLPLDSSFAVQHHRRVGRLKPLVSRAHTVHSSRLRPTPRSQLCRPHHRLAGRISRQRSVMRLRSSRRQTPPWAPCNARSRLCLAVLTIGSSSERLELPERREREMESHRRFNSRRRFCFGSTAYVGFDTLYLRAPRSNVSMLQVSLLRRSRESDRYCHLLNSLHIGIKRCCCFETARSRSVIR